MRQAIVPSLMLFLAAIIAAVPWSLPALASFILPLLLIIAVFVLTVLCGHDLPSVSVFFAGLLMDVLTAGPLGYWAAIFLLTHTLAALYRKHERHPGFYRLWRAFAVTAAAASLAGWALASLYFVRLIDWQPMLIGGAVAVLLFPLVAWPLRRALGIAPANIFAR